MYLNGNGFRVIERITKVNHNYESDFEDFPPSLDLPPEIEGWIVPQNAPYSQKIIR